MVYTGRIAGEGQITTYVNSFSPEVVQALESFTWQGGSDLCWCEPAEIGVVLSYGHQQIFAEAQVKQRARASRTDGQIVAI